MSNLRNDGLTYEVLPQQADSTFVASLKYNGFEVGSITSDDLSGLKSQFQTMSSLMEAGGMLRHSIIMLGYHNDDLSGDVLFADGELLGFWRMDDEEWCHFILDGTTEIKCSAPSPWMLHDAIAKQLQHKTE
ncbi:MAG: hypothetical protein JKX71_05025 [Amylibacter sp.]|nr:hypothetical protein [Amylibacter sp.]